MSELANLQETLPQSPAIWVRFDEDVPQYLRILITGPRGTPYSLGLFCFDLFVPTNYPNAPPVMKLLTTGRGTVRFSPNLYANGTVCLSLLNTWEGPKWRANQSTILQVLVSIQALILGTEHPYYLEPGRGGWEDGVKQQQQLQLQQQQNGKDPKPRPPPVHVLIHEDRIREGTLQYALLDMVRQQSTTSTASNSNSCDKYLECFQEIIQAHFYHYRQEMVETVEQWAKSWNAQSLPKNKLDKHVEQFREVVWKLKCPDFLDETVAASSQQPQQEEEDGIVLDKTKDDANTSARKDNDFLSLTRSQMEQAVAKGDYITAGRLQLEMKNVQTHGNVASIIATKHQQMEDRASLKDYIGAGEIQKELQYLEQHQTMLCDLEKRMFDAAWKLDFCKAGKIQQQYQLLLQTSSKDEQQLENAAAWRSGVVASTSSMPVGSNPKVMPTDGMWPEEEEEEEHDDDYYDEEDMDEMHQVLFGVDGVYQGNY
jgi:ubiquitin-protein ligase